MGCFMKQFNHAWFSILVFGFICFVYANRIEAEQLKGNLIIIYDASGSMSYDLDGKTKKDIVDQILSEVLQQLPTDLQVGVLAFGSRRQGDCEDVEEVVPIGNLNTRSVIDKLKNITPRGMSSIVVSLTKAVDSLKNRRKEEKNTILLIADGKDTCLKEPCESMNQIVTEKIPFSFYVMGVGVSETDKKQLECISEKVKGSFEFCQTIETCRKSLRNFLKLTETPSKSPTVDSSDLPKDKIASTSMDTSHEPLTATCMVQGGRVRQSPSVDSKIVSILKKGDVLSVLNRQQDWYHVKLADGTIGWINYRVVSTKATDEIVQPTEPKVDGKVKAIHVELTENIEKITVTFSDVYLPKTKKLHEAIPKLVCDFTGVQPVKSIKSYYSVNGKVLQGIRTGFHKDQHLFRIVMDLVPNQPYEINQNFMIKTNQYVIIFKPIMID